jgi:hypothetical protein
MINYLNPDDDSLTPPSNLPDTPLNSTELDEISYLMDLPPNSEILRQRSGLFSSVFNKKVRILLFYINALEDLRNKTALRRVEVAQVEDIKLNTYMNNAVNLDSLRNSYLTDLYKIFNIEESYRSDTSMITMGTSFL